MDSSTLAIAILIGVIQIILIFSVVHIADNTKKLTETLNEIKYTLTDKESPMFKQIQRSTPEFKSAAPTESWVCKCGARNYSSKTCSKCGAKKGEE